jgi:hypothetical protein
MLSHFWVQGGICGYVGRNEEKLRAPQNSIFSDFLSILRGFRYRGDWIRTSDHLNPIQVRYHAAPRPERVPKIYPSG